MGGEKPFRELEEKKSYAISRIASWGKTAWTPSTPLAICVTWKSTTRLARASACGRIPSRILCKGRDISSRRCYEILLDSLDQQNGSHGTYGESGPHQENLRLSSQAHD